MKLGRLQLFHYAKQLLIYAPAPLFAILGTVSLLYSHNSICGGLPWEMPLMWFLMAVTHSYPWVVYWEVAGCKHCGCSAMDEIQRKDSSAGF